MKQKTNKEVINAAFFALLTRNGVYLDYFHYWATENPIGDGLRIAQAWENWSKIVPPRLYINGAFWWDTKSTSFRLWADISLEWHEWLAANLNN